MSSSTPSTGGVPPEKHLTQDLEVGGLLRLGDDFLIEGNVIAPGGVLFGDNVVVRGDLFTDGVVTLGRGSRIEGHVRPAAEHPRVTAPEQVARTEPAARPEQAPRTELAAPAAGATPVEQLRFQTVEATLRLLWDLVGAEDHATVRTDRDGVAGLSDEALAEVLDGIKHLLDESYRDARDGPWSAGEVVTLLYQRVAPLLVPVEVTRLRAQAAALEIVRPEELLPPSGTQGWPARALTFLQLLTRAVRPGAELSSKDGQRVLYRRADPHRFSINVQLGEA